MQLQQSMDHYSSHLASHKLPGQTELGQILISTVGRVPRDKRLHPFPLQIIQWGFAARTLQFRE